MAANTGIRLLSALRRVKSKSALYDTPTDYFPIDDERVAFEWLRSFVEEHNAWPTARTFAEETGVSTVITKEPLSYYLNRSRQHALWENIMPLYKDMRPLLSDQNPDAVVELARQMITFSSSLSGQRGGLTTLETSLDMVVDDYDIAKRSGGLRGIPTGFPFLDEMTDGLQPANLYTTVARAGIGKSWKLLRTAKAARDAGYSVLFLTMEMGIVQVARRFFGMEAAINPRFLREGRLSTAVEREMRRQAMQIQEADGPPFYWLAGNFKKSVEALKAAAYETEVDLIIADASYLLKPSDRTKFNARHEILGNVMQGLHDISTAVNRPLYQSVQFNRMAVKGKRNPDDEENGNPIAHMSLDKIAGSDEIGQLSAVVEGITPGEPPHEHDRRYAGLLKGREGEHGWYCYNYKFQPFDMSQIMDHRAAARQEQTGEEISLAYMDNN